MRSFINMSAEGLGRTPWSVEERNEPAREQSCFTWVDEEEATTILN
jgi:hypothetical protein